MSLFVIPCVLEIEKMPVWLKAEAGTGALALVYCPDLTTNRPRPMATSLLHREEVGKRLDKDHSCVFRSTILVAKTVAYSGESGTANSDDFRPKSLKHDLDHLCFPCVLKDLDC